MKTYNVIWTERFSVNVEAKNEALAEGMIHNCNYDESNVSSEIDSMPVAYLIDLK